MQSISPEIIYRGNDAWEKALPQIIKLTKSPLVLGKSICTNYLRSKIFRDLKNQNLNVNSANLQFDCCDEDISKVKKIILNNNHDSVIAAGGGKVLDCGKYIAECLEIPCITVPLSASTCAGWTALSNIYSKNGQFIKDVALRSCPKVLVYDHRFIQTAPPRTLASGIADALAKWYESSITSSTIDDGLVQQAIQISRVLRDQLLIEGDKAFKSQSENNPSWRNTVEACGLTAGLVGGIGGEKCRTAAAHAIHNAITQIITPKKFLHGEIVGVGLLLQLRLEEMKNNNKLADQSIKQLLSLMKALNLPTTIAQLGINVFENNNLEKIADFTCRDNSEIHFLPFEIHKQDIVDVIVNFEQQKIKI
ncbi:oxidoreductase [Prochlorococcus marinus str. MU1404]|uniref:iron-containing alcohol dehydrogenase n=1 Tax=Prochlorococcus marinus TaxID=1219 RepID=UPI001AD9D053|nr:iron-containing alcohol dehydrogenase [Prochlorococcus marinus]MBO8230336.1 iron-containing alcohol dehydrogenase family protein [Prochlorococcus marinus XMU1404]MBW3073440.1 oxidoreductase [Prochlorococcus marinus str. MU1404]MCR8545329.1 iron-containing alcohol dehydrogenase [Prochlorococcus marinus CUG1432]